MRVDLVFFSGCPNVGAVRQRLVEALAAANLDVTWREWDTLDPTTPRQYLHYASPTVLVNDCDVAAGEGASGLRCLVSGGPSAAAIASALSRAVGV